MKCLHTSLGLTMIPHQQFCSSLYIMRYSNYAFSCTLLEIEPRTMKFTQALHIVPILCLRDTYHRIPYFLSYNLTHVPNLCLPPAHGNCVSQSLPLAFSKLKSPFFYNLFFLRFPLSHTNLTYIITWPQPTNKNNICIA